MKTSTPWRMTFLLALLFVAFAVAHHSGAVNYEQDTEIVHRDVTLLEWVFSNPHAQLVYEAPGADGNTIQWSAHTQNLTSILRRIRTNDFTKGATRAGCALKATLRLGKGQANS